MNKNKETAFNDNKYFEELCKAINSFDSLNNIKLKDDRIFTILNDYYFRDIYNEFVFMTQSNNKRGSFSCLERFKIFKLAIDKCILVESYKMPSDVPSYLYEDFKIKFTYIKQLCESEGIRSAKDFEEFSAVIISLLELYKEKNKYLSLNASQTSINVVDEKKPSVELSKTGKKTKNTTARTFIRSGVKKINKKLKSDYKKAAELKINSIDFFLILITASIFMVFGAFFYGDQHNVSLAGAIASGIFGVFTGSLAQNIFLWNPRYIFRDFIICLLVGFINILAFILKLY